MEKQKPDFYCIRTSCKFNDCPRHALSVFIKTAYHPELVKTTKIRPLSEVPELCRGKIQDIVEEMMG